MKKPNILLIILDATRADFCSPYNPAFSTTPALARMAEGGTLFQSAYATAPWTLPAMASILTGLHPSQTDIEAKRTLSRDYPSLASRLKEQGYGTFAISKNSWFSSAFGLTQDFDEFHKLWQVFQTDTDLTEINLTEAYPGQNLLVGAAKGITRGNWLKNAANVASRKVKVFKDGDYGAGRTLKPTQQWIEKQSGPWFAMIHYLEAHLEYKPPKQWARRFVDDWPLAQKLLATDQMRLCYRHITGAERLSKDELRVWGQLYAAEVAYQDHAMGQLLEWLKETGRYDDTLVIVVADHGESLGEHGLLNHLYGLYEPLIRVPLVMCGPGVERGKQISRLTQASDIYGTALAAAGAELPAQARNLLDPGAARQWIVAEYGQPRVPHQELLDRYSLKAADFAPFLRSLVAVRTETRKLITASDGSVELYDLQSDPAETTNLAGNLPNEVSRMQALIARWEREVGLVSGPPPAVEAPEVAPEVAARLRALGYLD
jgi:arylsulfatase A-like enzyme